MKKMLPDVNDSISSYRYALEQVGMERIEMPMLIKKDGSSHLCQASIDVFVNLINESKGIHMSRLYLILNEFLAMKEFSSDLLLELHEKLSSSQKDISDTSFLNISLSYPFKRKSLLSEHSAYRFYPITVKSSFNKRIDEFLTEISLEILYSSTCPCSAKLSEELIKDKLLQKLKQYEKVDQESIKEILDKEKFLFATPHAQRSLAKIDFTYKEKVFDFDKIEKSIDEIEQALKTPVQTVVKREDEQEFARLNGENLMFCEDACRSILNYLKKTPDVYDKYNVRVVHQESLHAHDAVAKGS